ncbi:helix-turn-helix domain-containing protein, partial [Streptomyces sp. NPDC001027]|uniref:TetR/AcrR family transcriptional regulator n=1 Tax=Streptomyces sp. NPDC001027 TaxID=3154771 RepID=UPI00331E2BD7
MARPRKPLLSTDRIVETARALVDAEGLAAVSTRRLAAELGVSGPSLYNHFRTKDEILEAVADSVSAQVDLSMFEDAGREWRTALHDWAVSYRAALRDHPNIVPVLAQGPGLPGHPAEAARPRGHGDGEVHRRGLRDVHQRL